MDKKKKTAALLKHFDNLTPLMFFRNFVCFKNKAGEIIYWDNIFQMFTMTEMRIHYSVKDHSVYRDDEVTFILFCAYEHLSMVGADYTLKVLTDEN